MTSRRRARTWALGALGGGTGLTLTEEGFIRNPVYRAMGLPCFRPTQGIARYLGALATALGEDAEPVVGEEEVTPRWPSPLGGQAANGAAHPGKDSPPGSSSVSNRIRRGLMNSFSRPTFTSSSTPAATRPLRYTAAVWRWAMPASTTFRIRQ